MGSSTIGGTCPIRVALNQGNRIEAHSKRVLPSHMTIDVHQRVSAEIDLACEGTSKEFVMYERILVPIDGSATSSKGLAEAIKLGKLSGASLRLFHVVDELIFATGFEGYATYATELIPQLKAEGEQMLRNAKTQVQAQDIKVDTELVETLGHRVCELVVEAAKAWHADLIVIGTHGRRGASRFFMGSDAEQIVRMAPVPVLLVR
jgi:nucleotide-binding universal stress UspA family protein